MKLKKVFFSCFLLSLLFVTGIMAKMNTGKNT